MTCESVRESAKSERGSARRGFTLIELLVVIAIIALLVSLLMPSLNEAKKLARASLCLSNLRLAAMAITPYSLDNEGWIPPQRALLDSNEYDAAGYDNIDGPLRGVNRYALVTNWWTNLWDPVRNGDGFFGPYIGATRRSKKNLVGCPSIPDRPELKQYMHGAGRLLTYVIERGKGYGTNYQEVTVYSIDGVKVLQPKRLDKIIRPVDLVYCCDTVGRSCHVTRTWPDKTTCGMTGQPIRPRQDTPTSSTWRSATAMRIREPCTTATCRSTSGTNELSQAARAEAGSSGRPSSCRRRRRPGLPPGWV